jgi:hypothetical protein
MPGMKRLLVQLLYLPSMSQSCQPVLLYWRSKSVERLDFFRTRRLQNDSCHGATIRAATKDYECTAEETPRSKAINVPARCFRLDSPKEQQTETHEHANCEGSNIAGSAAALSVPEPRSKGTHSEFPGPATNCVEVCVKTLTRGALEEAGGSSAAGGSSVVTLKATLSPVDKNWLICVLGGGGGAGIEFCKALAKTEEGGGSSVVRTTWRFVGIAV